MGPDKNDSVLGYVCFAKNTFWETIFQTFLCLFVSRKVGQRKTLSGQRKTLSSQRKIHSGQRKTLSSQFQSKKNLALFSGKYFPFNCVCFPESGFQEITFQTFLCLFAIRKVGHWKTLSSKRKIWLGFQESVFLENLGGKHFPEVVKKLEMSYYLLIISNLVLKLLIVIYILF